MDREKYIESLYGSTGDCKENRKKMKKALKAAHDIRKFEIELYWKRALYFWGFQVAVFTAFAVLFSETSKTSVPLHYMLPLIISFLGGIMAIGWYYVAKASNTWKENWEEHIDLLEINITGNLYKTILQKTDAPVYSISGINQFVIGTIAVFWLLIVIYTLCIIFNLMGFNLYMIIILPILIGTTIFVGVRRWIGYRYKRTFDKIESPKLIKRGHIKRIISDD